MTTSIPKHTHGKYNRKHLVTIDHRGMTKKEAIDHKAHAKTEVAREFQRLLGGVA